MPFCKVAEKFVVVGMVPTFWRPSRTVYDPVGPTEPLALPEVSVAPAATMVTVGGSAEVCSVKTLLLVFGSPG